MFRGRNGGRLSGKLNFLSKHTAGRDLWWSCERVARVSYGVEGWPTCPCGGGITDINNTV